MTYTVEDHWLNGPSIQRKPTTNYNPKPEIAPKYIVIHGTRAFEDDVTRLFNENGDVKESAHLYVATTGEIVQYAPFNVKTWHAGVSYWQGHHGLNGFSIGIYVQSLGGSYSPTLRELLAELVFTYNIRDIMSHGQTCSRCHCDEFDITPFKGYVNYGNADSVGRFCVTSNINVRAGPGVAFEQMDTISSGEGVKVLRYSRDEEWAFVLYYRSNDSAAKHGWVHESFLRRL